MIHLKKLILPIKECVIAHKCIAGNPYLAKNRDRSYAAKITIIREIINETEVVYIHDKDTDWSEGINEYGIGIINSALMVNFDEKEKKIVKKKGQPSKDGHKIRTALSKKTLSKCLRSIVNYVGDDDEQVGVKGHTFVANPKHSFSVELTTKHIPSIKKLNRSNHHVRTNHGYDYPDSGYSWEDGPDYKSSHKRHDIAHRELKGVKSGREILSRLSKHYQSVPNHLSPYRDTNKLSTTSQILMDLANKVLTVAVDKENGEFLGIDDRTPEWYEPKIKIKVLTADYEPHN